ncbi:MAG: NADH-quinone oxidoreductase subunit N, partial [Conexibacteraceae bacterium]|nr:NADH-quinone oxidoreductase subunit N [Conexibacteraceae bacterium]
VALAGAIGTEIWRFNHTETIIAGALRIDGLGLIIDLICAVAAIAAVLLSWRHRAPRDAGQGEFYGLLLFSVMGMAVLSSAQDVITLFIGLELLSIPLYILCAAEYRREGSLESGLKYLIIGSIGSATLVYGLAMVYGATGQTGFDKIAHAVSNGHVLGDPLLLGGIALVVVGFAFKASVAPFHQWTPDVYEGAPTPITAFMATATKAAALAVLLRFFDVAVIAEHSDWGPALAALATATILIGNVGALGQTSLKRMLGFSGVAQAGYMLSGVVVATRLGVSATTLYLIAYLFMNIAAFAVVQAQEVSAGNDRISGLAGLGRRSPVLAWAITIAMLGLAGIPGTIGFIGKFQLIHALVDGNYTWLAIILVVGAMISLGYYLRVVAAVWMSPATAPAAPAAAMAGAGPAGTGPAAPGGYAPIAGGSPEADGLLGSTGGSSGSGEPLDADAASQPYPEILLVAAVFGALTVIFGVIPGPVFTFAAHAGAALTGLL